MNFNIEHTPDQTGIFLLEHFMRGTTVSILYLNVIIEVFLISKCHIGDKSIGQWIPIDSKLEPTIEYSSSFHIFRSRHFFHIHLRYIWLHINCFVSFARKTLMNGNSSLIKLSARNWSKFENNTERMYIMEWFTQYNKISIRSFISELLRFQIYIHMCWYVFQALHSFSYLLSFFIFTKLTLSPCFQETFTFSPFSRSFS